MTLDAPKSDAQLLREHAEKTGTTVNGVVLGPGSSLLGADRPWRPHAGGPVA